MNRVLLSGLLLTSGCSPGLYTPDDPGATVDAGPDEQARIQFSQSVAPILVSRCDSCHKTGLVAAPIFEGTYESITGYTSTAGSPAFLSCTDPTASWLIEGCKVMGHPAAALDPATEEPLVRDWIMTWSTVSLACQGMTAAQAVSGPFTPQPTNDIDLSTLGPGLTGARLTFTADDVGGSTYLSNITLHAGPGGLKAVHPIFESCVGAPPAVEDPADALANVDVTVNPDATSTLPAVGLSGVPITAKLAIRFDTLTPAAGAEGPPADLGGACSP